MLASMPCCLLCLLSKVKSLFNLPHRADGCPEVGKISAAQDDVRPGGQDTSEPHATKSTLQEDHRTITGNCQECLESLPCRRGSFKKGRILAGNATAKVAKR